MNSMCCGVIWSKMAVFTAASGIKDEARQTLDNIKTLLQAHGYSMGHLVKCNAMLADIGERPAFNEVYQGYFKGSFRARSAFSVSGLAFNARVELTCIGAVTAM